MTMKDDNLKGYIQAGRYAEDNNTTLLVILELIYRGDMPAVKKNDGKWYVIKDFPFPLSKRESVLLHKYCAEELLRKKNKIGGRNVRIRKLSETIKQYQEMNHAGHVTDIYFDISNKRLSVRDVGEKGEVCLSKELISCLKEVNVENIAELARLHIAERSYDSYRLTTTKSAGHYPSKLYKTEKEALEAAEEMIEQIPEKQKMILTHKGKNLKEWKHGFTPKAQKISEA